MNFKITIDKQSVFVNSSFSLLQACEFSKIVVPRFCYHERLSIAGNCRMCLVEIDGGNKLIASCAMPVSPNLIIRTNSLIVKKAREGILEFLLINHPLDCPICDQGGECDLQDQAMIFGSDRSRFKEHKRAVDDKKCGPLINTVMTRCIHCTRCIRFTNEIVGLPELGSSGRGNLIEISLYIKKLFKSEFSGNVIDLCPVGALTSKSYNFIARAWDLKSYESIDTFDAIGSNIRIDIRGYEIMRVLPRLNESINEEWISNKTRFGFDGLKKDRLYDPLLKNKNGKFKIISWHSAIAQILMHLNKLNKPYEFCAQIGEQADVESIFLLKHLINKKNGTFINVDKFQQNNLDFQTSYKFNSTLNKMQKIDFCIFLAANSRIEIPIVNLRLRQRYVLGNFKAIGFCTPLNLTFPVFNLGSALKNLISFIEGNHEFCKYFVKAKMQTIIVGPSIVKLLGGYKTKAFINILIKSTYLIKTNWNGINFLSTGASCIGFYELGLKTKFVKNLRTKVLYSIGQSNLIKIKSNVFIIYQAHHGNSFITNANLILPSNSFIEKTATFVNLEGRYQKTKMILESPGNAKGDLDILYTIIDKLNFGFNNSLNFLYERLFDNLINSKKIKQSTFNENIFITQSTFLAKNTFIPGVKLENFYLSNDISKASSILVKCSKTILNKSSFV